MFKFLILSFVTWKIWVMVFLFLGVVFVEQRIHFLGGGLEHYLRVPWFWAWGNFDGEHYLSIAQHGYGNGEQAFFPFYPLIMRFLVWQFRGDLYFLQTAGLIISNVSFILALVGLWKLLLLDFKRSVIELTIILLLVFPASFFFGNVYTEGLFFALTVWSFYLARIGKWWLAGILGGLASSTRFLGIILLSVLLIEWIVHRENKRVKKSWGWLGFIFIPLGLLSYMYYLKVTTGDPLAFLHTLTWFGEQRSSTPILLPQVFWRYIKIIIGVPKGDPLFFSIMLEFVTAILFLSAGILSFFKLRLSYAVWLFFGYLLPTLSGSFSSLPRYVIVLFPAFILFAVYLNKMRFLAKILIVSLSFLLLGISTMMFVRGYWLA